ncbi:inner-membrane translocator [Salinarchaeum sp. Harcht-Bsk1]|uniref:ABC transporter permease n=1 Tax=Salinarchaeum sp. Harcht-Bsk1 TaxID=1333523 RepID=UPI0003422B92|nr:ABC transporter permease [Salinarchaeum sp. Harcht-Bsk1]AGN01246.1 inner-membrane translocator [Salinarchaeum sp. Harcht-Bsk1]
MNALGRLRGVADRMATASGGERLLIGIGSVLLALFIGSIIVFAAGYDPITFLLFLFWGAFGSAGDVAFTLRKTTLLILAGVAVALAFRANIFNIGVQGQLVVGGFGTAMSIIWLAPYVPSGTLGGIVLMLIGIPIGMVCGGLYAAIPGVMKAYADANEVITTLMLNFIATGVLFVLVDGPLKDPDSPAPKTVDFPDSVEFPSVVLDSSRFSLYGLLIALAAVVVVSVVMNRTAFGYDLRTSGEQAEAAAYSGVIPERMIVSTMVFSGIVAGLCGAVYTIMVLGYYQDPGVTPTFGFDAIAVSLLAANNPIGVVPSSLLFGSLSSGKQFVEINQNVPQELVDGIVGLIVLFVATPELFRMAGRRRGDRE